jgi:hypothetical protein
MPPGVPGGGGLLFSRRDAAEVAVFEPVTVAFEGEDFAVVDEPVDHRGGGDLSPKISPQAPNGLLLVTIRLARS